MAACVSLSECGRISISLECSATVLQGESYHYEMQLTASDGTAMDVNEFDAIVLRLYGSNVDINYDTVYYGNWSWPISVDTEITGELISLQEDQSDGTILNQGMLSFDVSHELTSYFSTGPLYAELKLKKQSAVTGQYALDPEYYIISCLKIGNVKSSHLRDFTF